MTIYIENIVKDARGVIKLLQKNGVDAMLLSGGFRRSIIPLAEYVGIPKKNIYANDLIFGEKGEYLGFDGKNLLSQEKGKKVEVRRFKSKVRYRRHIGFRPLHTKLEILSIGA